MLYPGEATTFARAGLTPEEGLSSLFSNLNAHQALLSGKQLPGAREDLGESSGIAPPEPPGPRASRDLASIRRNLTVTTSEIAFLAGKRPTSVTHWRKGKKGFPEPVTGGRSPLFNLDEVHDWLELHDKLTNEAPASWLWRKSVQALHQTTVDEDRSRLRGCVAAMVVVLPDFLDDISGFVDLDETTGFDQWRDGTSRQFDDELAEFLQKHLVDVDLESESKRCSARAFRFALESGYTEFGLLDEALDALAELSEPETTTSMPLTALINGLIGDLPNQSPSVIDLACGEATVLVDLLNRHRLPGLSLKGVEKDPESAAIARIRLQLHASLTKADWRIEIGDCLAGATLTGDFDAVVLDPPSRDSEEWVALAKSHLTDNDNSRAFVLLPWSALKANGPCSSSIKRNQLEAIILLPNRLKRESRRFALCVITNGKAAGREILHIDLSNLKVKNLPYGTATPISSQAGDDFPITDVCAAISHWRTTRTINEELLPGRQKSIRTTEAAKHGVGEADKAEAILPPKPSLIVGAMKPLLRHTFLTAIGDLIDFSLTRKAKVINAQVDFSTNADGELVAEASIADNGTGMDRDGLIEALRIGSRQVHDEAAVHGYPPLGLTASAMTFCNRVKLVSTPGSGKPAIEATMDLEQMLANETWRIPVREATLEHSDEFRKARETLSELSGQANDHGTLVICDRGRSLSALSGGRSFKPEDRQRALVEDLRAFLDLLFSEYAGRVVIAVNGETLSTGQSEMSRI
jgi:tRNA1(Val) A37 N6-methylase TrmN6